MERQDAELRPGHKFIFCGHIAFCSVPPIHPKYKPLETNRTACFSVLKDTPANGFFKESIRGFLCPGKTFYNRSFADDVFQQACAGEIKRLIQAQAPARAGVPTGTGQGYFCLFR